MSQRIQVVQNWSESSTKDEANTVQDHQCVLFDALSVSNCLSTHAFMIDTLVAGMQETIRLSLVSFEPREPHFFQPRAPPLLIL